MSADKRRKHRGWAENFFLEPIYYWFDLYGPDGRPSHSKTLTFVGYLLTMGLIAKWGSTITSITEITWPFVALIVTALMFTMGKSAFTQFAAGLLGKGDITPPTPKE